MDKSFNKTVLKLLRAYDERLKFVTLAMLDSAECVKLIKETLEKLEEIDHPVDKKELNEALRYFGTAEKYGYGANLDDMTDQEVIDEYHKCLAHENIDRTEEE